MKSLHWLPIAYQIRFKLCVFMHGVHNGTSLSYLMDITTLISSLPGHRWLCSAVMTEYDIPCTRTKFGFLCCWTMRVECSFADIRNITDLSSIKWAIKTLFYWHIRIKQFYFSRLYYVRRFWTILWECKMHHINGVLLNLLITPVDVIHDISILLDSKLTTKKHINKITSVCFYHLWCLKQVRRLLGTDITTSLFLPFVVFKASPTAARYRYYC